VIASLEGCDPPKSMKLSNHPSLQGTACKRSREKNQQKYIGVVNELKLQSNIQRTIDITKIICIFLLKGTFSREKLLWYINKTAAITGGTRASLLKLSRIVLYGLMTNNLVGGGYILPPRFFLLYYEKI